MAEDRLEDGTPRRDSSATHRLTARMAPGAAPSGRRVCRAAPAAPAAGRQRTVPGRYPDRGFTTGQQHGDVGRPGTASGSLEPRGRTDTGDLGLDRPDRPRLVEKLLVQIALVPHRRRRR